MWVYEIHELLMSSIVYSTFTVTTMIMVGKYTYSRRVDIFNLDFDHIIKIRGKRYRILDNVI